MIRLSKLSDYGIVILAHLAGHRTTHSATPGESRSFNARELAAELNLPAPMVSKVLKILTRAEILESQRGARGGYRLARRPEELTVVEMITAMEGPVALTQCNLGPAVCDLDTHCAIKNPWQVINHVVHNALASITLADLTQSSFTAQLNPLDISRASVHPGSLLAPADPTALETSERKI